MKGEFDRQVRLLVDGGFVANAAELEPLRDLATGSAEGLVRFVVVVSRAVAPREAIELVSLRGGSGFTDMGADELERFVPTEAVSPPPSDGPYCSWRSTRALRSSTSHPTTRCPRSSRPAARR